MMGPMGGNAGGGMGMGMPGVGNPYMSAGGSMGAKPADDESDQEGEETNQGHIIKTKVRARAHDRNTERTHIRSSGSRHG